ncbi:homoserine kinase [Zavarzinia sp. CC-PAN008]|uniref:homoserine kinase n=1 Tax=Zavarzinia sp. CC-PAN008 TaxID=3243332 RepID=UPI003F7454AB
MAVYTEVGDEDLSRFLSDYDIGTAVSFKGIAEGVENSNFLLETTRGRYILTLYEKRVAKADLPFFLGLMDHLAARGLACPQPVHGRDGRALRELAGRPAAIATFLEGMWPRTPTAAQAAALGAGMAELHLKAADFTIARPNALSVAGWHDLAPKCLPRADEVEPGLARLIAESLAELTAAWPADLPVGVIHADLFPDNAFFLGDRLTGIIDFYFACNDALAYDLAVGLNAWAFAGDRDFEVERARAMVAAYDAVRPLAERERAALPLLVQGAALRFLLTRLYDWLNQVPNALVRPKDPLEYAAKLRFWRAAPDLGALLLG